MLVLYQEHILYNCEHMFTLYYACILGTIGLEAQLLQYWILLYIIVNIE